MRARAEAEIRTQLQQEAGLSRDDRERLAAEIADDVFGYGPLEQLLPDPTISEIMVNGAHDIWIERRGLLSRTSLRFSDESHLRRIITKMVGQVGRRIDESSPMVDARLPDGSRINAIIAPLSLSGPLLTIRKFDRDRFVLDELVADRNAHGRVGRLPGPLHQADLNILVSGGTGSGKTTLLNALSAAVPDSRPHRHDRGRGRAAALAAPRAAARVAPEEHRGRRRGDDPRPRPQRACGCVPTGSSSARFAARRRSTCSRR